MGRPVVLSNGQLFVGLDENGLVHDFYYPYVGLENLTTARSTQHKIGVWVDGHFSWTDDGSWTLDVNFEAEALISNIRLHSDALQITLHLQDFVDAEYNALIRRVHISNETDAQREVRLFMHQVFEISRNGRSDTALYVPDDHYVLDYKGRYSLLIAGKDQSSAAFDQYAVGNYGIENKAGTFKDAEDGILSDNPVEHGGVDSVIRFKLDVPAHSSQTVDYWVIAASSQTDAAAIHKHFNAISIDERINKTRSWWHEWLQPSANTLADLPEELKIATQKSLLIIKAHCDDRGSVLASGDSSIYNYGRDYYCYCWPRDAAYALWPLIRLGHFEEARNFFAFARDTMHPDGYLMHKYQPDRAIGSTWHPLVHGKSIELAIQEDETAAVIFMIREYLQASGDTKFVENLYHTFVEPGANFMTGYIDEATGLPHASYDLWEQVFLTTTYSTTVTIAGLEAASSLAQVFDQPAEAARWQKAADGIRSHLDKLTTESGYFRRGQLLQPDGSTQYNDSMDIASLYGPFMYARLPLDDERMRATLRETESKIKETGPIGGVIRYPGDDYFLTKGQYGGNPWIVCTLWLAQYYQASGRQRDAEDLLNWAMARRLPSGVLSEQFDPENGSPLGVAPLVWSHAELVNTILDVNGK
jgi:GH15 family glucan-1,4-alpha-glucosidase